MLQEQFDAYMTYSVSKNLKVEYEVAKQILNTSQYTFYVNQMFVKNLMQQLFQH